MVSHSYRSHTETRVPHLHSAWSRIDELVGWYAPISKPELLTFHLPVP